MKKILCIIFGHQPLYNLPVSNQPTRMKCNRCHIQKELNLATMEWENVNEDIEANWIEYTSEVDERFYS
jgi:hypothetical protein